MPIISKVIQLDLFDFQIRCQEIPDSTFLESLIIGGVHACCLHMHP